MTVLSLQVAASADDGYSTGTSSFDNSLIAMFSGLAFPNNRHVFARFTGTSGLQDATINAATFSVYRLNISGNPNAVIYADKSASPVAPTDATNHAGKTRTSAGISWNVSGGSNFNWHDSPSIATVIQELVDAFTPTSIQILFDDVSVSNSQIGMRAYDGDPTQAAKLTIDYTPPNTPPTITVAPSVNYNGYTRLGPSNTPGSVSFTATDPEETGSNELSYEIRTASGSGGTLVASGNFTSGVAANVNIAHNASGLSEGSNTLYLRVSDGTDWAPTNPSFTLLVDRTQPATFTPTHNPNPVLTDTQYTVNITANDSHSTGTNELSVQVRTAASGGGTLLWSGSRTASATPFNTTTITDAGLVHGSNTRYVRVIDGAGNVREVSFTVTAQLSQEYFDEEAEYDIAAVLEGTEFVTFTDTDTSYDLVLTAEGADRAEYHSLGPINPIAVPVAGVEYVTVEDVGVVYPIVSVDSGTDTASYLGVNPYTIIADTHGTDTATLTDTNVTDTIVTPTFGIDFRTSDDTGVTYPILSVNTGTEQSDSTDIITQYPIIGVLDGTEQYIPIGDFDTDVLMSMVAMLSGTEQMIAFDEGVTSEVVTSTTGMDRSEAYDTGSTIVVTPTTGTDVRVMEDLSSQGIFVIPTGGVDSSVLTDLGVLDRIVTVTDGVAGGVYQDTGVVYPLVFDTSGTEFFGWTDLNTIYTIVSSLSGTERQEGFETNNLLRIVSVDSGNDGIVAEDVGVQDIWPTITDGISFQTLIETDGLQIIPVPTTGTDTTQATDTEQLSLMLSSLMGSEQMDAGDAGVLYPIVITTTSSVEGMDNEDVGVVMPIVATTSGEFDFNVGIVIPVRVVHFGVDTPYSAVLILG